MNSFCAVPRKQNVAIFNQAFDFPALSLHKTERRGQDTLQRKLLMRITSLVTSPLIRSSCFSSRDHAKLKIRSEAKFVIWRGGPPDRGCSQRHLAYEMHGASRGGNHGNFRDGDGAAFLVAKGQLGPVR